jgi:glucose-6-phosphate 1-dehydrogenase
LIRAGKCLPVTTTEVLVKLRQPPLTGLSPGNANYLRFRLSPEISLNLGAMVKRPGAAMVSTPVELSAVERTQGDELDAYERLLGDAMRGDALLFVRQDAVEAAWSIVEPILGNVTPVHAYEPDTWGPAEAEQLAAEIGGWHNPQEAS